MILRIQHLQVIHSYTMKFHTIQVKFFKMAKAVISDGNRFEGGIHLNLEGT